MARILILFGTTDGQTGKIARTLRDDFLHHGAAVDLVEAGTANPDPAAYDGVVVAASIHYSGYQAPVKAWVREHAGTLNTMPAVFLSVCLAVLQHEPEVQQELRGIVDKFIAETGWHPMEARFVAGALLYRQYGWLKRFMMRRIAAKAGGDTDTSRDYEYTDWAELEGFAATFHARLARVAAPIA